MCARGNAQKAVKIEGTAKRGVYEAYISIGSNIGDRVANCFNAMEIIGSGSMDVTVLEKSSLYETDPWGKTDQGPFVNAAIKVSTSLGPAELLAFLKSIESRMERTNSGKWGPRVIDLDIVFYGNVVSAGEALTIPHSHAHERAFVLIPIAELAPGLVHPVFGKTVTELAATVREQGVKKMG